MSSAGSDDRKNRFDLALKWAFWSGALLWVGSRPEPYFPEFAGPVALGILAAYFVGKIANEFWRGVQDAGGWPGKQTKKDTE